MRNEKNNVLLSSETLTGTNVENGKGEKIGNIRDFMIDVQNGEVAYAVLSVNAGFLNLESKYFAVPLSSFAVDVEKEILRLDIDKERLKNAPGFDKDNWPTGAQEDFMSSIYNYYGVERRDYSKGVEQDHRRSTVPSPDDEKSRH